MAWHDLIKDPGLGNLNLRAYVATVVGPRRIAHGQRRVHQLQVNQSTELAKNAGRGLEALYVEAWLPRQAVAVGLQMLVSSSEGMGESAELVTLGVVGGGAILDRYRAVLLPNEQLYAQPLTDAAGQPLGDRTPLVVSTVFF